VREVVAHNSKLIEKNKCAPSMLESRRISEGKAKELKNGEDTNLQIR